MAFRDCVSSALKQGAISREEAEDLVRRFEALEAAGTGFDTYGESLNAKERLTQDLRAEAVEKRRRDLLTVQATDRVYGDLRRYAILKGTPDVVGAAYALFEHFGTAGFSSVRGIYNALLGGAHAEMADLLHQFRRGWTMARRDWPGLNAIVDAAFGGGNDTAKQFYRAWLATAEKLRDLYNEAGGHIPKMENWGMPIRHAAGAVLNAGFERWRDFIEPRLNWDIMKHGVSGADILIGERPEVLRHVYDSIVSDGWNTREPGDAAGRGALYNQRTDARFLAFKDADAWRDYNTAFGTGDVFNTMMGHVRSMARDVALMQRLGPNPAAMVRYLKDTIAKEGANLKLGEPSLFAPGSLRNVGARVWAAQHTLDGFYDVARGSGVPASAAGDTLATWRNVQYGAKMGGAVIMHSVSNPVIMGMARYLTGHKVLTVPLDILKGLTDGREIAQAGMIIQDATHTLERGARENFATGKMRELSQWLPAATAKYSGLEAVVEANRRAAFLGQMAEMAGPTRDLAWPDLDGRLRAHLQGGGFGAADWEALRAVMPYEPERGAPILRWQDVRDAGAPELAQRYLEMLHTTTEAMVPSSNWYVHAKMAPLNKMGGLPAEVGKSAAMFKAGFMATFMLSQMQLLSREIHTNGIAAGATYAGAATIALTVAGLLALQAKQLRAGKDLRSMDPTTKEGLETWAHAALTSGAAGVYGDFIASDQSAYGHGLLSTLAGPVVTGATDAFSSAHHLFDTSKAGPAAKAEGSAVSFLRNNTPVLSTHWALQAAYNRVILDQLQYLADPDAHTKMRATQRKVMKETGQGYFWPPGATAPERAPGLAGGP